MNFIGNVQLGKDVSLKDLHEAYDSVLLVCFDNSETINDFIILY